MAQDNPQHFNSPLMYPIHRQQHVQQPGAHQPQPIANTNPQLIEQHQTVHYAVPRQWHFGGSPQQYMQQLHRQQQLRQAAVYAFQSPQQRSVPVAVSPPIPEHHFPQHLGKHPSVYNLHHRPIASSAQGIDLNSAVAAKTPNINFVRPELHHTAIHILPCPKPASACFIIKRWMLGQFANNNFGAPGVLRIEGQDLHSLDSIGHPEGSFVLLEDAAHLDGEARKPITVIAVLVKGDPNVRWFYNMLPPRPMLDALVHAGCLTRMPGTALQPGTDKHRRMFVYLREAFLKAVSIPDHPDYLAAQQITDYCPDMRDPDTACARLEASEKVYQIDNGKSRPLDLAEDRYTSELHPAESSLAAHLGLRCSAYLLVKRKHFHQYWKEILQFRDKIGQGRLKVRTEHAHEGWLVDSLDVDGVRIRSGMAKRLVLAWRLLGFLDERMLLPWLRAGGLLEKVAEEVVEEAKSGEVEVKRERGDGRAGRMKR